MGKSKKVKYDMAPYTNYINYLQNYDTSNVDNTLSNLTNYANKSSTQNLQNMGNYTYSVDGSDDARKRTEEATYNAYVEKLTPEFEKRRADLATALQNKGLGVGTEAYERAMSDLEKQQNDALKQAAYASVLNGQNAFTQSLGNEVTAGSFGNSAQQAYINQLLSALNGSASGYENQQNLFGVGTGLSNLKYQQDKANAKGGWEKAFIEGSKGAMQGAQMGYASSGSPWGAVIGGAAGGSMGAYSGYQSNPYT